MTRLEFGDFTHFPREPEAHSNEASRQLKSNRHSYQCKSGNGKTRPSLTGVQLIKSGQGLVMRTKIAFAVLFTAWFWPQAQAQGDRPPYPPPPPPPLFDQPDSGETPQPQRPLNHPVKIEPTRPKERGSTKPGDWRGTVGDYLCLSFQNTPPVGVSVGAKNEGS
jgi:hypothetical protein